MAEISDQKQCKIIPLGGLGNVGGNATLYESDKGLVLVDCGILFAGEHQPGIDFLIPNFDYITNHEKKLLAIVCTHAHEDHIGALPFLLEHCNVPIYASPVTLSFIETKLRNFQEPIQLNPVAAFETIILEDFTLQFLPVTHSVPHAFMLSIASSIGQFLHTGDYRFDPNPHDNRISALSELESLGKQGILALMGDSTNAMIPGHSHSEQHVSKNLRDIISHAPKRVVLTTFSSHLHRIAATMEASVACGRKILLEGRSIREAVAIARNHKIINIPEDCFLTQSDYEWTPAEQICIIASGSQGEPFSAMTKIAKQEHPYITLEADDIAILSAREIPGNEVAIGNVINALIKQNVTVHTAYNSFVHTSGHGHREELLHMLQLTQPHYLIPIHGELRHQHAHAQLGIEAGLSKDNIHILENGDVLTFSHQKKAITASIIDHIDCPYLCVDGKGVGDVGEQVLKDRHELSQRGIVFCSLIVSLTSFYDLKILTRGVIFVDENEQLIEALSTYVQNELKEQEDRTMQDDELLQQCIRKSVRRFFKKELGRKPMVLTNVHRKQ